MDNQSGRIKEKLFDYIDNLDKVAQLRGKHKRLDDYLITFRQLL